MPVRLKHRYDGKAMVASTTVGTHYYAGTVTSASCTWTTVDPPGAGLKNVFLPLSCVNICNGVAVACTTTGLTYYTSNAPAPNYLTTYAQGWFVIPRVTSLSLSNDPTPGKPSTCRQALVLSSTGRVYFTAFDGNPNPSSGSSYPAPSACTWTDVTGSLPTTISRVDLSNGAAYASGSGSNYWASSITASGANWTSVIGGQLCMSFSNNQVVGVDNASGNMYACQDVALAVLATKNIFDSTSLAPGNGTCIDVKLSNGHAATVWSSGAVYYAPMAVATVAASLTDMFTGNNLQKVLLQSPASGATWATFRGYPYLSGAPSSPTSALSGGCGFAFSAFGSLPCMMGISGGRLLFNSDVLTPGMWTDVTGSGFNGCTGVAMIT